MSLKSHNAWYASSKKDAVVTDLRSGIHIKIIETINEHSTLAQLRPNKQV